MILIVGCGFLGCQLVKYAASQTNEKILATIRNADIDFLPTECEYIRCDVTEPKDLEALREKCKNEKLTVFYFAACHNIDYIYDNPSKAATINVTALENFLEAMPEAEKLFFASTDCVYGESNGKRLSESALTEPVNEYGKQKLMAEKIVIEHGFTVLRYPFMLGPSLIEKPHFYDNICNKLKNEESIEMIDGMKRSVISYSQAAQLTYALSLKKDLPHIINVCADKAISKYETGISLAKKLGAPEKLIKKISEKEGQKFFRDKRASCTEMDNTLIKSLLGIEKINWEEE